MYRDLELAAEGPRCNLKEDKQLSLLKLRVAVKERVAILGGEIESEEQLREAAQRVEKVPGIAEVRLGLVKVVPPRDDNILTIPLLPEPPSRTETLYRRSWNRFVTSRQKCKPTAALPASDLGPIPEIVSVRLEPPIPLPTAPLAEPMATPRTVAAPARRTTRSSPRSNVPGRGTFASA